MAPPPASATSGSMMQVELDLRGLKCPLPVLKTRRALSHLPACATLVVSVTDPMAAIDIPHLLRGTGDYLNAMSRDGDVLTFEILRVGGTVDRDAEG